MAQVTDSDTASEQHPVPQTQSLDLELNRAHITGSLESEPDKGPVNEAEAGSIEQTLDVTSEVVHPPHESETQHAGSETQDLEDDFLEFRMDQRDDGIIRYSVSDVEIKPQVIRYTKHGVESQTSIDSPISPIGAGARSSVGTTVRPSLDQMSLASSPSIVSKRPITPTRGKSSETHLAKPTRTTENKLKTPEQSTERSPKSPNQPSEYSHMELQSHNPIGSFPNLGTEGESDHENMSEEEGWQEMKTVGDYDVYDDQNKIIVHKQDSEDNSEKEDLSHVMAAKGYTKVTRDEDAKSITSMDEETNYLFDEDELQRNPLSQLQATKDMLTDAQRIAYVGLCRLIMVDLATDLAHIRASRKVSKPLSNAQGSMAMWTQKMMMRLYAHMDLSSEEQIMIEQLGAHGVVPSDLSPSLIQVSTVKNPFSNHTHDGDDEITLADNTNNDAAPLEGVPNVSGLETIQDDDKLEIDIRWTLLCDLFLVLISDSVYDSRSRTMLEQTGKALGISSLEIAQFEKKVTDALEIEEAGEQEWDESDIMEKRRKKALRKKYAYVGLATLGGGLVIGLSAGLLAPVIGAGLAAGFTTIGITGTSGFLAGAGGAAVVTTTGAAIGARIGQSGMTKRMGHVKTFEFRPLHNHKRVNAIVTVSGWMSGKEDDVRLPFSTIDPVMGDLFSVLWEPEMLQSMGQTINILATEALTQTVQQVLGSTLLVALMASIQLPMALSKLGYLLDNPWNVSLDRAWASGLILADSLIQRNLGVRPITLVGFSLGARVIYSCLLELSRRGAFGLIQDVYIFGAPVVVKKDQLALCRSIVSGRFVNGYSSKDWILGYLFRATAGGLGRIGGLAPVSENGIENFDCTEMVEGHMGYRKAIPKLLTAVGWEVLSEEFAEIEDPDPEQHRERQRRLIKEFDEAKKKMESEQRRKKKAGIFSWIKPKKKEWWEMAEEPNNANSPSTSNAESGGDSRQSVSSEATEVVFDLDAIQREVYNIEKEPGEKIDTSKLPDVVPTKTNQLENESEASSKISMSFDDRFEDDYNERGAGLPDPVVTKVADLATKEVIQPTPEIGRSSIEQRPSEDNVEKLSSETEQSVTKVKKAESSKSERVEKEEPYTGVPDYDDDEYGREENVTMSFFE